MLLMCFSADSRFGPANAVAMTIDPPAPADCRDWPGPEQATPPMPRGASETAPSRETSWHPLTTTDPINPGDACGGKLPAALDRKEIPLNIPRELQIQGQCFNAGPVNSGISSSQKGTPFI